MHSLILGQTESGKTLLAKMLAKQYKKAGKTVIVLDPMLDNEWGADVVTDNPDELMRTLERTKNVYVFVDESGQVFAEGNDESFNWLGTRSRHYGHSVHFVGQRIVQMPKTMREQANKLFLFTNGAMDGKIHAEEWNKEELAKCNMLPQFHFMTCTRFSDVTTYKIVDYSRIEKVGTSNIITGKSDGGSGNDHNDRKMGKGKRTGGRTMQGKP